MALGRCYLAPSRSATTSSPAAGQATTEFALVVIILLFAFMAIVDFGRLVSINSAVVTASREAARYGAATGVTGTDPQYVDCPGIRDAARRVVGGLVTIPDGDIVVSYDRDADNDGVFTSVTVSCGDEDAVQSLDRVIVQVTVIYRPITPLLQPIVQPLTIVSIDRRTIVKAP